MAATLMKFLNRGQFYSNISKYCGERFLLPGQKCCKLNFTTQESEKGGQFTHFGFQNVSEEEKEEKVYQVFHNVAEKYDVMNDAMSAGIHRLWKDYFMEQFAPTPGTRLIDVAGGTGDIAFRFLQYIRHQENSSIVKTDFDLEIPQELQGTMSADSSSDSSDEDNSSAKKSSTHVTVCDINQAMLDVGKRRAAHMGHTLGISWLKGNAEALPVDDNSYDAYTIAYGIRNCTHVDKVLAEARRVLKPGGRFMCLEFSYVPNPVLRTLYNQYSFQVIPVLGQIIASDWKSYQYLVESIRKFPKQEEFADMLREAGFQAVTYENLLYGVSAIHSGFKL